MAFVGMFGSGSVLFESKNGVYQSLEEDILSL